MELESKNKNLTEHYLSVYCCLFIYFWFLLCFLNLVHEGIFLS
jgi:hypothetical protein